MSVLIVTTVGNFVIDLHHVESPKECLNFVKLCKHHYYDMHFFYNLNLNFIVQTGNPEYQSKSWMKETSIWGLNKGKSLLVKSDGNKFKHNRKGNVSLISSSADSLLIGSQFMITLTDDERVLTSLDKKAVVVGEILEGLLEIISKFNETIVDDDKRPLEDIIILHTYVIHDPFPEEKFEDVTAPDLKSLTNLRIFMDEDIDKKNSELNSKLLTLEMIGDLDSRIKPSEKVLFICKLNPVTKESDLQIIFQRFGNIENVEIIKDKLTGKSLNYGFIEFNTKEACEALFLKMDNVLIDDRRIHVDFSQSIAKEKTKLKTSHKRHRDDYDRHGSRRHKGDHERSYRRGHDSERSHEHRDGYHSRNHDERASRYRDHGRRNDERSYRYRDDRHSRERGVNNRLSYDRK